MRPAHPCVVARLVASVAPTLVVVTLALGGCLGGSGAPAPKGPSAPQRVPSVAEILAQGPQKSADVLTGLSHSLDSARLGAAFVAAATCPATETACRETRLREALETFAASAGALELLVAMRREVFPTPIAYAPDDDAVYKRLGLSLKDK